ncbi:MAG: PEGA domain-containing protein [bacterium]
MNLTRSKTIFAVTFSVVTGLFCVAALAQSGRSSMHGYVAFDDLSYLDVAEKKVHATIELRGNTEFNQQVYAGKTDEHGSYDLKAIPMGEYVLKISSPGYRPYQTEIYLPSDFNCSLAVMLKREKH